MVPRRELAIAAWGAGAFGAVLASYGAFRPVRDALILDGNPDQIPWLFTATFVGVAAASPAWSAALARTDSRKLVPRVFHAFAACELAFFLLVRADVAPVWIGRAFYVWSAVFSLFVVSVLWSLFADVLGPRAATTLYGPITAGGTVGAIVGPALTKLLVGTLGVAGILALSACLLEVAVVCAWRVVAMAGPPDEPRARRDRGGAWTGIRHVVRSPYLVAIVGYVLCTACAATFLYLDQVRITHDALADRTARTAFLSTVDLWTNSCVLVVQLALAAPLLRRFGPGVVLCVLPLVQLAGLGWLALAPSLTAFAIAAVVARTATHGLTRPARELLFTVIARDDKYRAKNVIDTTVYRLGDFGASWMLLAGAGSTMWIAATVPLVAIWLALAVALGFKFRKEMT
ncbi:MAG TPA: MFS transporter [Kofleriaceae bacterium]|jgi:AAA family ATP:ADP antiporter